MLSEGAKVQRYNGTKVEWKPVPLLGEPVPQQREAGGGFLIS